MDTQTHTFGYSLIFQSVFAVTLLLSGLTLGPVALADDDVADFRPGNLLVSRVVCDNNPNNVVVGMTLPPNCVTGCVK